MVKNALTTTGINNALVDNILTISDGKSGEWFRKDVSGEKKGNVSTLLGPQLIKTTMARHMTNPSINAAEGLNVTLADDFLLISHLILEAGKIYRIVIAPTASQ